MNTPHQDTKNNWAAPFFTIWIGQALSLVGSQAAGFALVWWLTRETGSGVVLATSSMAALLPQVFLGPFIGALVDRWNRRRIILIADTVVALLSAWLAYLFWADALQIWHVYLISFARSVGGTFHHPAMQASTSLMVPDEQLPRVAGMNQTLHGLLTVVAPPLGALLMSVFELHTIMAIDVITAAFAIAPLLFIHIPQPATRQGTLADAAAGQDRSTLWQDVREGFLYIWHWPGMRLILLMAVLLNFLIHPAMSLLPLLVTKHFGGKALQLGWINSAWGVGLIAGGLALSTWGGFKRRIVTSMCGTIGMGLGFVLVGFAPASAFWLAVGALFLAGAMNSMTNGPMFAMLQSIVAPEKQGRVFMIVIALAGLAAPLGLAIAGPLSDAVGSRTWFVIGGIACAAMGVTGFAVPAVMNLEQDRAASAPPAQEPAPNPQAQ
jgi:DHA3 family macrolide efflux protein-like MFS transporter